MKIADFGLAKIVSQSLSDVTSASGPASRGIIGTPEYMSPEQMQPGTALDPRADIYALGTIAYHMLGGRPPFTGDIMQLIAQKMMQEAPPLSSLRSDLSAPVEHAVMHAIEKDRERRPPTVIKWFDELWEAASESTDEQKEGESRLVIMAPTGAEVYVDDERHGSIGRSGRIILTSIPPGQHKLRVARSGDEDDERVIEIRPDADEQIIQAQFKSATSSGLSPSRGGSLGSVAGAPSSTPGVVACTKCGSRFAATAKFCGRCGNTSFRPVTSEISSEEKAGAAAIVPPSASASGQKSTVTCSRCGFEQSLGVKFCGRCGASLGGAPIKWSAPRPVEVICPTCRHPYPAGTKFCGRCGRTL